MNQVFFFTGDNATELQEKLRFWQQEFIKKHTDSNLEVFDEVTQEKIPQIANALESTPFLAEKRMVILRGFPFSADVKRKVETESLEEVLKSLPDSTLAIFVSPNPDKRSRFYKWLNTHAKKEEFLSPKGREIVSWIQQKFQRHQKAVTPRGAETLAFFCGDDLNRLFQEIEKLSLLEAASFDEKAIEQYVTPHPEAKIFKALDLVGNIPPEQLLKVFHQLMTSGEDGMMVFYMIVRQFRLLVQIKSLQEGRLPRDVIQKKMKLAHFQIGAFMKQSERFRLETLKRAYRALTEIEYQIKTGKTPTASDQSGLLQLRIDQFLYSLYE
ncbi:MAG: DNA polymerase III subunit delta [Candidatus Altimarinota bacterium]